MLQGWVIIVVALAYIGLLFLVASLGDRRQRRLKSGRGRPTIYALSLGVYCTSWTFFGAVGLAAHRGFDFLTIYIGPIVVFALGYPLLRRVIQLAKAERITSIADFLGARYGKSQAVAATVALIAVVATVPYIALQLKAVSSSVSALIMQENAASLEALPVFGDLSLLVALFMAAFAILFGTRHIDATEHQEGLMLAVAAESAVKLVCMILVGAYVTYHLHDGPADLWAAAEAAGVAAPFRSDMNGGSLIAQTLLSLCAILLLPRMFHVTVVEHNAPAELRRATWMFPLYLVVINLFVVPIALAGLIAFGPSVNGDLYVLSLPMHAGNGFITLVAFIGGLSAATAMVIVACVALSIMISNDLVIPFLLRQRPEEALTRADMGRVLLLVRRVAILAVMMAGYAYYRVAGNTAALASIGFLSFAAIAQLAPAFLFGLVWRRASARGAIAGMAAGFALWVYTLLIPALADAGLVSRDLLATGLFGLEVLRPQALFNIAFEPFTHGVFWSLTVNMLTVVFVSLTREPAPIERLQASIFVPAQFSPAPSYRLWRTAVTVDDLRTTVARYIGEERAQRSFARYARETMTTLEPLKPASIDLVRFAEQLLASAIGAASARLVLSLLLKRRDPSTKAAMKLLDDASEAIQYSRDLMQTALDQVAQGIGVFDQDLRLICWNRRFRDLLDLPAEFGQVGTALVDILRYNAERGLFGPGAPQAIVDDRLDKYVRRMATVQETLQPSGTVLEIRSSSMPDGGIVLTATDITDRVEGERALARANESLERRVKERTEALLDANDALARAKAAADEANIGKTRFLAAASHDILQPLNAARLYTTTLVERSAGTPSAEMVAAVDASLESVEEILGAVLDISRLDTGALRPEVGLFRIDEILKPLKMEFEPLARDKGLDFRVVMSTATVRSDRRLLRRLLQNLISNAIKYTQTGRVLVGCRRRDGRLMITVHDTGIGIPAGKQATIFEEFRRLEQGAKVARGLGLGLSIVERIGKVLDHPVSVTSAPGLGSRFAVEVPQAPAVVPAVRAEEQPRAPLADLADLHVVCIDNEPRILDGMQALLTGWGCRVTCAPGPKEAAQALKDEKAPPDILLVDYHLDEGTGVEAVVRLRWRFGEAIPAILITANRSPGLKAEAAGKDITVLFKPLKPAALRALLAQHQASRAAAAE
ncbi:PAS domain-containing hybrid sensor histidine kinase/response regulator [Chthonobacter rhizosphaerae]|uniref:PAS domain-containing hybrid sensor histidine kinase/response regulator n=1 Tax=Chthonobacter rhizosphaerae TaxID=2735553 RepID=UPI0015EF70D8|nr:PAS domain-containing hybrid sensor histidine kinase/response regulator [Chthonobacter rhizosphaerae]